MTHIASNDDGLQVRDLISELGRFHPTITTNIADVIDRGSRLVFAGPGAAKEQEMEHRLIDLQREIRNAQWELDRVKAEKAALFRRVDSARAILRRIKRVTLTRRLPLP